MTTTARTVSHWTNYWRIMTCARCGRRWSDMGTTYTPNSGATCTGPTYSTVDHCAECATSAERAADEDTAALAATHRCRLIAEAGAAIDSSEHAIAIYRRAERYALSCGPAGATAAATLADLIRAERGRLATLTADYYALLS